MKKIGILLLIVAVILGFIACDDNSYEVPAKTIDGAKLQALIDSADENSKIELENATYKLSEPLYITKPISIIGATNEDGTPASIIDYSEIKEHDMNNYPNEADTPSGRRTAWIGGVNIYSGDVTFKNIKIVGDLDWAIEQGAISSKKFFERQETNEKVNYTPIYGLYINPVKEGGDNISTLAGKILVDNVEITKTTGDAILVNHVGAHSNWYTKPTSISPEDTDTDVVNVSKAKDSLILSNLNIYENGNIEVTKNSSNGVFLRNSTNITLKDSSIDTGVSGAPIWIHASEYRGPFIIENVELKGKYLDSEDNAFCFKNNDDAGAFKDLEAPIIFESNKPMKENATISYLFNGDKGGNPLIFDGYEIKNDNIIAEDSPNRVPLWGENIIAITK